MSDHRVKGNYELDAIRSIVMGFGGIAKVHQVNDALSIAKTIGLLNKEVTCASVSIGQYQSAKLVVIQDSLYAQWQRKSDHEDDRLIAFADAIKPSHCDSSVLESLSLCRFVDGSWAEVMSERVLSDDQLRIVEAILGFESGGDR